MRLIRCLRRGKPCGLAGYEVYGSSSVSSSLKSGLLSNQRMNASHGTSLVYNPPQCVRISFLIRRHRKRLEGLGVYVAVYIHGLRSCLLVSRQ